MRSITWLVICLAVSACSTVPQEKYITQVPPERMYGVDDPAADVAATIIRNCDFVGGGAPMHLWIDGIKRLTLRSCERAQFKVTAGHHQFTAKLGGLASALGNDVPGALEIEVSGGSILLRAATTEGGVSIYRDMTPPKTLENTAQVPASPASAARH